MANHVEQSTRQRWVDDRFTATAIGRAIEIFIARVVAHVAPDGIVATPKAVEYSASTVERFSPEMANYLRSPEGFASGVVEGTLGMLLDYDLPPLPPPANTHYADQFYSMPELREALGLKRDAMKARKPKARKKPPHGPFWLFRAVTS